MCIRDRFQIEPYRITFDIEGIGADFSNRLDSVGLKGCQPYRGGGGGTKKYFNLRTGAAWRCRQRLDPNYQTMTAPGVFVPQTPFSLMKMPDKSKQLLRRELQEMRCLLYTSCQGRRSERNERLHDRRGSKALRLSLIHI